METMNNIYDLVPVYSRANTIPKTAQDKAIKMYRNKEYPKRLWYCIACFIALVAFFQFASNMYAKFSRRGRSQLTADPERSSVQPRRSLSIRRLPVAILNVYRIVAFRCTIPIGGHLTINMAEVTVTAAYIVALFTWAFIDTKDLEGVKFDINYWGNRTGVIAASQLPLITALGGKNNIIGLLTGIRYERLSYLHRMMSRVVLVMVWLHGGSKITAGSGIVARDPLGWVRAGLLAGTALSILCIVTIRPVRARSYEAFYYVHLVLVIIFLVSAFVHANSQGFGAWIWPSFVVWGIDRALRAIRLVAFNYSYFGLGSGSGTCEAKTELLSEHFVRLTLRRPAHFHWTPGQTALLIVPEVSGLPFEAHPFTIASHDSSANGMVLTSGDEKALAETTSFWKDLVFLIDVRAGFTKRLEAVAAKKGTVKVVVDGPYGTSPDLGRFDTVVLIAGGSGVSYALPWLIDIIENVRLGKSNCTRLSFVWAIREGHHIRWAAEAISKALERSTETLLVSIRIFITGTTLDGISWDNDFVHENVSEGFTEKVNRPPALLSLPSVTLTEGRPDIHKMLDEEMNVQTVSVRVCASDSLTNAVRSSLRSSPLNVARGAASVSLHVEYFAYA